MEDVLAHWPFVAASLIFAMFGQVVKGTLFTRDNILKYKGNGPAWLGELLWWGRKTMPVHPVVAGILLGFVPGMPVGPGVDAGAATVLYFGAAGMASTWAFALLRQLAKRQGIELDIPRQTDPPPPN